MGDVNDKKMLTMAIICGGLLIVSLFLATKLISRSHDRQYATEHISTNIVRIDPEDVMILKSQPQTPPDESIETTAKIEYIKSQSSYTPHTESEQK